MANSKTLNTIRHWLPILTFCPVNRLPDLIYVSVTFVDEFAELYQVRKKVRKLLSGRCQFMEDLALEVFNKFPTCKKVEVRLAFNRHYVSITRGE